MALNVNRGSGAPGSPTGGVAQQVPEVPILAGARPQALPNVTLETGAGAVANALGQAAAGLGRVADVTAQAGLGELERQQQLREHERVTEAMQVRDKLALQFPNDPVAFDKAMQASIEGSAQNIGNEIERDAFRSVAGRMRVERLGQIAEAQRIEEINGQRVRAGDVMKYYQGDVERLFRSGNQESGGLTTQMALNAAAWFQETGIFRPADTEDVRTKLRYAATKGTLFGAIDRHLNLRPGRLPTPEELAKADQFVRDFESTKSGEKLDLTIEQNTQLTGEMQAYINDFRVKKAGLGEHVGQLLGYAEKAIKGGHIPSDWATVRQAVEDSGDPLYASQFQALAGATGIIRTLQTRDPANLAQFVQTMEGKQGQSYQEQILLEAAKARLTEIQEAKNALGQGGAPFGGALPQSYIAERHLAEGSSGAIPVPTVDWQEAVAAGPDGVRSSVLGAIGQARTQEKALQRLGINRRAAWISEESIQQLNGILSTGGPTVARKMIENIHKASGDRFGDVWDQLSDDNKIRVAAVGNPYAEDILRGVDLRSSRNTANATQKPYLSGDELGLIDTELSKPMWVQALGRGADAQKLARGLAESLWVAQRTQGQSPDVSEVVRNALGGSVKHNGTFTLPPRPGMNQGDFDKFIYSRVTEMMVMGQGAPVYVNASGEHRVYAKDIRERAQFEAVGDGRYAVTFQGLPILDKNTGGPFYLNLGELAQ